ncbi:ATP-grasp domain-containing protein [Legionella sp. WA2024007413]
MNILLTGAGGASAISVWKSLAKDHTIYMCDMDPNAAGLYLVPPAQRSLSLPGDAPDFVNKMLDLCQKDKIDLLIPTVDSELAPLAAHDQAFKDIGTIIPLSPYLTLKNCFDKYLLLNLCKDTAPVPDFHLVMEDVSSLKISFPCFAKPRVGAGSRGCVKITDPNDFERLPRDGSYLIQELLPGEEYSVDVYIHSSGRPLAAVPRLRMKIDSGIAVTARSVFFPELQQTALSIAKVMNIKYAANIQFKASADNIFKLLEINPRFPGTLPLTTASGIDMPKLLIKDINNEELPEHLMPFKETMMVRYWTEHFLPFSEWMELCQN